MCAQKLTIFWSLQLHDFNDGTLYWWGWWQWCNIFLTTWSGGGKIGMSSRGSSGVTEQLILRSQWTTPSMLLPMVGWAHPILVVSAQFDEVYLLWAHWLGCSSSQGSQRSESPWQWTRTTLLNAAMCKVCGKEGYINNIMRHIEENHITGLTQTCNLCGKNSRSKDGLRQHRK